MANRGRCGPASIGSAINLSQVKGLCLGHSAQAAVFASPKAKHPPNAPPSIFATIEANLRVGENSMSTLASTIDDYACRPRQIVVTKARVAACFLAAATCFSSISSHAQPADLSALGAGLNLQPQSLSVSGLSSGAFMAQQFHVAYSQWVIGAGIVAGGPSGCAQHQAHGTPTVVGPITNSIAWGVNYCTSFSAKSRH